MEANSHAKLQWNALLRLFKQQQQRRGVAERAGQKPNVPIYQRDIQRRQEVTAIGSLRSLRSFAAARWLTETMLRRINLDRFTTSSIEEVGTEDGDVVHVIYDLKDEKGESALQKTDHGFMKERKATRGHLAGRLSEGNSAVFFISLLVMHDYGVPLVFPLTVSGIEQKANHEISVSLSLSLYLTCAHSLANTLSLSRAHTHTGKRDAGPLQPRSFQWAHASGQLWG